MRLCFKQFAAWVEAEALISINVKLFVIVELLNGGRYQNTFEWAQEQAVLSGRSVDDALRERLHKFYDKRVTFDRAFNNGEQFRYGALNGGGVGLPEYDPYCVVLTRTFQRSLTDIAWLPGDSLKICFASDGSFHTPSSKAGLRPIRTVTCWLQQSVRAKSLRRGSTIGSGLSLRPIAISRSFSLVTWR
jgi:hypothetical protein